MAFDNTLGRAFAPRRSCRAKALAEPAMDRGKPLAILSALAFSDKRLRLMPAQRF